MVVDIDLKDCDLCVALRDRKWFRQMWSETRNGCREEIKNLEGEQKAAGEGVACNGKTDDLERLMRIGDLCSRVYMC